MIKAEKNVIEAFASPTGQVIAEFLADCGEDLLKKIMVADGHELYRTQGSIQELREITNLANNARNILHS